MLHYLFHITRIFDFRLSHALKLNMKKIFGVENWVQSTELYPQKTNVGPGRISDSFYDARSDEFSNDEEDVRYLSFPGFTRSSTDDDEMVDGEILLETDNDLLPDDSGQRGDFPILVPPDWRMLSCRRNESTFPDFLEICSTVHISPVLDHIDENDKKQSETENNQSLNEQSPHNQTFEVNEHPVSRKEFFLAPPSLKTLMTREDNLYSEIVMKSSSKQIVPLNKNNNSLSLHFDSKAFFQTSVNMQCSEYWTTMENYVPPEKKRRLLPISRHCVDAWNQPLCQKISKNNGELIDIGYSDEMYKFQSSDEDDDKVTEGINIESGKSTNKLLYARYIVANNESTDNEESLEECEAESEESDVEINKNSFGIEIPKETLNSTFCVEDRHSNEANPTGSHNQKNSDSLMSKTIVDFFPENKPIVFEYLDYESRKTDTLIAYPVVCLETIKPQISEHLTKQEMVERLMEISVLRCEKPIGIIHGVKDILSSYEKKLQRKKSKIDTRKTINQNHQFAHSKTIDGSNTSAITKTPINQKSIKSKIPCSIKSKEDVAKRKVRSEECALEMKTPFPLKISQSNISTNTYVKRTKRMIPFKRDFLATTEKSMTFSRKRGNREEIISSDFKSFFRAFAKLGNRLKSGAAITKTNSKFWLKKTGVVCDKESVKMADEYFSQIAGRKLVLNISDYIQYLIVISRMKTITLCDLVTQLKTIDISEVTHLKRVPSSEDTTFYSKATASAPFLRKKDSSPKANVTILSRSKIPVSSSKAKCDLKQLN